jgi:hypothetical protein
VLLGPLEFVFAFVFVLMQMDDPVFGAYMLRVDIFF